MNAPQNNLSQFFRNSSPGPSVVQGPSDGEKSKAMIDRAIGPMQTVDPEKDEEYRKLVSHCLRRDEKLTEFAARTGLGKATILAQKMTPAQISQFCLQADKNNADDPS